MKIYINSNLPGSFIGLKNLTIRLVNFLIPLLIWIREGGVEYYVNAIDNFKYQPLIVAFSFVSLLTTTIYLYYFLIKNKTNQHELMTTAKFLGLIALLVVVNIVIGFIDLFY